MTTDNYSTEQANPFSGTLSVSIILDGQHNVLLKSEDIIDLYFIEDIFSHVLIGKFRFYDKYNIQEKGPVTGTEKINVIYGGRTKREIVFSLYNIKYKQTADVNPVAGAIIEATIVDSTYTTMLERKYSRSFTAGMTYTTIINYMLQNIVKWDSGNIHMEECSNESPEDFAIPYWTIAQTSRFLLKRAVGKVFGTSGYLIYNSTEGDFSVNVKTLNYLFGKTNAYDPIHYHFEMPNDDSQEGQYQANKILEWSLDGPTKSGTGLMKGARWRGCNTDKGTLDTITYNFADGIAESLLLGKKALFSDISDANQSMELTAERNNVELKAVAYDEWCKVYALQNKTSILLEGNEKRYCGHLINVEWPSYDNQYEIFQKQQAGLWLIRSITHSFKPGRTLPYMQRLNLLKNAYTSSNSTELLEAELKQVNITGGVRTEFLTEN